VDDGRCITGKAYTIYIEASLDTTTGWRRMIGADGWGDSGWVPCVRAVSLLLLVWFEWFLKFLLSIGCFASHRPGR
jgi:hypothetical protein